MKTFHSPLFSRVFIESLNAQVESGRRLERVSGGDREKYSIVRLTSFARLSDSSLSFFALALASLGFFFVCVAN